MAFEVRPYPMSRHKRKRSATERTRDVSRLFRALANKYRRAVVRSLDETHTPIPRDALATYVAKEVFPKRSGADFIAFRDRLLLKLHHVHLPMLAKAGVIELDAGQIEPGATFAEASAFLDELP